VRCSVFLVVGGIVGSSAQRLIPLDPEAGTLLQWGFTEQSSILFFQRSFRDSGSRGVSDQHLHDTPSFDISRRSHRGMLQDWCAAPESLGTLPRLLYLNVPVSFLNEVPALLWIEQDPNNRHSVKEFYVLPLLGHFVAIVLDVKFSVSFDVAVDADSVSIAV
jgi:hypothetical protein